MQSRGKKRPKSKKVQYRSWKGTQTTPEYPIRPHSPLESELQRTTSREEKFLEKNIRIANRWHIKDTLGTFGRSHVYLAYDDKLKTNVAIKAYIGQEKTLEKEHYLLKKMQHMKCSPRPIFYSLFPDAKHNLNFLIMTLHGPNTETLLKRYKTFSLGTVLLIGRQMLQAIDYLHCCGYIHRDIKPANFVVCLPPREKQILLIDLSTTRSYLTAERRHVVARKRPGFRGTMEYASPRAHNGEELSRRDDLWSMIFCLLAYRVKLPWFSIPHHPTVREMKLAETNVLLRRHLRGSLDSFKAHLETLDYYEEPDYDLLRLRIENSLRIHEICSGAPYEWSKQN